MAPQDTGMVAVRGILIRLRKRSGLNPNRLHSTEIDASSLLRLSAVLRYAHLHRTSREDALTKVVALIAQTLPPTERLIVDAELCLELFRGSSPPGVDVDQLYAADLGERRRCLARQWAPLHRALGVTAIPPTPTARTLRDSPEASAFTALAEMLASGVVPQSAQPNTVTIVGDAVYDQIHHVEQIPGPDTSTWGAIERHPGGKGLNRAVALSRLGLDARLLAAIGDDLDGKRIQDYLSAERVDISLMKVRSDAPTPVTTVIMPRVGGYATIADRESRTVLTAAELDEPPLRQAIADSKAVLLTFEQADSVVEQVMKSVAGLTSARSGIRLPWMIVNISPPRALPERVLQYLHAVDYLVGSSAELAELWPNHEVQDVIEWLLRKGVGTVCAIDGSNCSIHGLEHEPIVVSGNVNATGAAGAASAFASALTYRVVTSGRAADLIDFEWAMAAWAASQPNRGVPDAMPDVARIEQVLTRQTPGD